MAQTRFQVVPHPLLGSTPQSSPHPLPSPQHGYTRDYSDEDPYSDPTVYEIHPVEASYVANASSLYAPGLSTVVTQTILPSAPVTHVAPWSSAPPPSASASVSASASPPPPPQAPATNRRPGTQKEQDLTQLEHQILSLPWYAANALEPTCGSPDCPYLANCHGIRGLSCYTAFVDTKLDGTHGCWREECSAYSAQKLEDAVKHQRTNHFNHKPFLCGPTNGNACGKRFFSHTDLQNHRRRCH